MTAARAFSGYRFPAEIILWAVRWSLLEVEALPAQRDLDDAVQLARGAGARHHQAPPHHRADPEQPRLEPHDPARVRG
jgi:hypothetical protein